MGRLRVVHLGLPEAMDSQGVLHNGVIAERTLCKRKAKCSEHVLLRDLRASLRGKIFVMDDMEEKSELLVSPRA